MAHFSQEKNNQLYLATLYSALFITTYYGLFRIGEVTQGPHTILANNVHIGTNKNKLLFILFSSKTHDRSNKPQLVKIAQKQKLDTRSVESMKLNPFHIIDQYIRIRPAAVSVEEQFFVFADNSPVKPDHMWHLLKLMLIKLNLNPGLYSVRGMHAGHASDLLDCGVTVETIKKLGRWKSNAVFTYLRH